ncbi:glycosyltransferase family 25 protein [Holospora curviuscula]|uniref:Glycosyltransferase family 25 (LPS biosynthesis protein) n=1 Tax=Holospora curviuscula TaxID=1082868 RepID=A0A2S5R7N0_9PROT|nr:glycosyltransferase family 25 protein [Holospora curviuscula]PPE03346.1 Glycosyltransferase family 25 (LPS biosynthesis protein) [Holospora curviuscula]
MCWNKEEFLKKNLVGTVLNLKCNPQRYASFLVSASRLPFKVIRLEAQDGAMLSEADQASLVDERIYARYYGGKFPSQGTIGCYLTHYLAWKSMVDQSIPWMIIFEDDVIFCPETLTQALYEILTQYKKRIDICSFALRGKGIPFSIGKVLTHRLCAYGRDVYCAGAYLLNLKSARQLLHDSFPMQFQVDDYYTQTWRWNLLFTGIEPRIVHHNDAMVSEVKARGGRHFRKVHYSFPLRYTFVYGIAALRSIILREYFNLRRLFRALSYCIKVRLKANYWD